MSLHPDEVSKRDKDVAKEVIRILEENQTKSFDEIKSVILESFHIEKMLEKKVEDSMWYKFTKEFSLGATPQGYRIKKNEKGKKVKIPFLAFSADTDTLDNMLIKLLEMVKSKADK
jgi:hydroxymethylpyrimidine pyrophosphatase-like HAD family hydrolase